ncbi:hypothetical protein FM069_11655 [Pseudomonas mangiferae]|uniref:Uncharacterized protein n=1 Tax=Pseudomonas mangiferae TaxID=2593654 RepID=A0A553GYU6_9PSED|nr:hypothetical protein FM069_11655 [Pseudomonas mangiferae]
MVSSRCMGAGTGLPKIRFCHAVVPLGLPASQGSNMHASAPNWAGPLRIGLRGAVRRGCAIRVHHNRT